MLWMYRRRRVGEMAPSCRTRLIFMLFATFDFADLSCKKHWPYQYILPETPLTSIFSKRPSR